MTQYRSMYLGRGAPYWSGFAGGTSDLSGLGAVDLGIGAFLRGLTAGQAAASAVGSATPSASTAAPTSGFATFTETMKMALAGAPVSLAQTKTHAQVAAYAAGGYKVSYARYGTTKLGAWAQAALAYLAAWRSANAELTRTSIPGLLAQLQAADRLADNARASEAVAKGTQPPATNLSPNAPPVPLQIGPPPLLASMGGGALGGAGGILLLLGGALLAGKVFGKKGRKGRKGKGRGRSRRRGRRRGSRRRRRR